ncbi:transporter substrate-binding domain-containing protein [Demequina sp. SO4-13]|uniref:transporter substrate-binding domain-containing protein n=1 Tax=Demequina sp. SO4-13 TaxID=3401027 RepID=UPI003AF53695
MSTTRTTPLLTAAAAALTLVLAGCSTGDDATDATTTEPTGSATGSAVSELLDDGILTVGTEGTYRPFSFHTDGAGDLTGYDVEVVTAVAEELDVEIEFEETQWDAIFAGLEAGRFDVVANQVSITPDREEKYVFSAPYTVSRGVIVVPSDETDISSFADLDGRTAAQSLTSNWHALAEDSGANIEAVEGWAQSAALVQQGRVDATINDKLTFLDYQTTNDASGLKIAAETDEESQSAFTFRQDSEELAAAFDEALAALSEDGTLAEISEKYFGEDVSG